MDYNAGGWHCTCCVAGDCVLRRPLSISSSSMRCGCIVAAFRNYTWGNSMLKTLSPLCTSPSIVFYTRHLTDLIRTPGQPTYRHRCNTFFFASRERSRAPKETLGRPLYFHRSNTGMSLTQWYPLANLYIVSHLSFGQAAGEYLHVMTSRGTIGDNEAARIFES